MDPLTALGLAGNLVQIVDFTSRLVHESYQVIKSGSESLPRDGAVKTLAEEFAGMSLDHVTADSKDPREIRYQQLAQRCSAEATDLLRLLQDLKINNTGKSFKLARTVRQGLRSQTATNKIESSQRALEELSGMMNNALLELLRCGLCWQDRAFRFRLTFYRDDQAKAFMGIVFKLDEDKKHLGEKLIALKDDILRKVEKQKHSYILGLIDNLEYPQQHDRHDDIFPAAQKTFDWAYTAASCFREWLSSKGRIFWVSGKAGSGKSTFMKFLQHNEETAELLSAWAPKITKLRIARHYFWHTGSLMQKTHEGLLRSLLSQLLRQTDECDRHTVVSTLWPDGSRFTTREWSREKLSQALLRVQLLRDTKFCFFIDGLDEYFPLEDHAKMVRIVVELSALSNVKVCISSRPWDIFRKNFADESGASALRLEDLTKTDMMNYVEGELKEAEQMYGYHDDYQYATESSTNLSKLVVDKAEGVFLWVHLVVKDLKEEMAAGRSIDRMFRCVDEVPPDLHDFFRNRIYNRIKWRRRPDTARALRLAVLLANVDQTMDPHDFYFSGRQSFMTFWLLTQNEAWDDHDYVAKQQLRFATGNDFSAMARETSAFLEQTCRDLLRVKNYGELRNSDGTKTSDAFDGVPPHVETSVLGTSVQLLHRTVFDFLVTDEMEDVLRNDLPVGWKDRDVLPVLDVARLLMLPIGYEDPCGYFLSCQSAIRTLWSAKRQHLPLLESRLDALVQEHFKLICRPRCTRHGHHMEFMSTAKAQTQQAYFLTLLDKHPQWCLTLCLPDSLVKGGNLSSFGFPVWSRCIMTGFAAYDEASALKALIQLFDMVDKIESWRLADGLETYAETARSWRDLHPARKRAITTSVATRAASKA
jgi:hypothetical protein